MADLDRLAQRARAARDHVRLEWDDGHVDVLLRRTKARARRRTVYRVAVAAAAVIVLSLSAAVFLPDRVPERVAARALVVQSSETERVLHLADGSVVALLGEDSDVVIMRVSEEEIRLRLTRGAARFQVVPGLERAFRVNAGDVDIDVLGTTFEVRRDGAGARVRVLEGQVRVTWPPAHEARLTAGGEGRFPGREPTVHVPEEARKKRAAAEPPTVESPATEPPAVESPNSKPELASAPHAAQRRRASGRSTRPARSERHRRWVELAEAGDYEAAADLLDEAPLEEATLDELLLASDTMRLAGRPLRALDFLDRAAALAETDHRAPIVAFTRGRLLLTALSRPHDAAEAFAQARALAPDGALAMDALAREVEARARAGDAEAARARAEEYIARYPNGLRVAAVRRWGALEP